MMKRKYRLYRNEELKFWWCFRVENGETISFNGFINDLGEPKSFDGVCYYHKYPIYASTERLALSLNIIQ
jgi:alpha-glucosidase (family GH31 glycosyl hydrolase)